jgi:hypothetical protein
VIHQKNNLEGKANEKFSGLADYAKDANEDITNVIGTVVDDFAFMSMLPDEENDEITIDEEIKVNAIVCNTTIDQNNSIHHNTSAFHHIFHKHNHFHNYATFKSLLAVHGFWNKYDHPGHWKGEDHLEIHIQDNKQPLSVECSPYSDCILQPRFQI